MPRHVPRRPRLWAGLLSWAGALVLATGVGLTAVGAIGDGIVGPGPRPLTPAEVDARLAAATSEPEPESERGPEPERASGPAPAPTTGSAPASPPPVAAPTRLLTSQGGTVLARCAGATARVVSVSPAQGFRVHDVERDDEPGAAKVEFAAEDTKVELRVRCVAGRPSAEVQTEADD